jgi:integrase
MTKRERNKPRRNANGNGSVYPIQRGKKERWIVALKVGVLKNGRPQMKIETFDKRAQADSRLREMLDDQASNQLVTTKKQTVAQYLKEWLDFVKDNQRPLTYRGYEQTVRVHIIPVIGHVPLGQVTPLHAQAVITQGRKNGLGFTSRKNVNATLRSAMSQAEVWKYRKVNSNPAFNKLVKFGNKEKYVSHPLSVEQAEILLNSVAGHRYEAMFYVALMMGLRRGELAGLGWFHIDFHRGLMQIHRAVQRLPKQGQVLAQVKTDGSFETLPIPPTCLDALRRRQIIQQKERLLSGSEWVEHDDFVFTSRDGAGIILEDMNLQLDNALAKAKLPHVRLHDLRHTTASLLLAKNVHMKVIQEIMRHSTMAITSDLYSHLQPTTLVDTMQIMNDIFAKSAPVTTRVTTQQGTQTVQ